MIIYIYFHIHSLSRSRHIWRDQSAAVLLIGARHVITQKFQSIFNPNKNSICLNEKHDNRCLQFSTYSRHWRRARETIVSKCELALNRRWVSWVNGSVWRRESHFFFRREWISIFTALSYHHSQMIKLHLCWINWGNKYTRKFRLALLSSSLRTETKIWIIFLLLFLPL